MSEHPTPFPVNHVRRQDSYERLVSGFKRVEALRGRVVARVEECVSSGATERDVLMWQEAQRRLEQILSYRPKAMHTLPKDLLEVWGTADDIHHFIDHVEECLAANGTPFMLESGHAEPDYRASGS